MRGRMRRRATGLLLGLATLGAAAPAGAQQWAVEVRGGAAVGNYTATEAGLDMAPRLSFGATVERRLLPMVSVYVGVNRSAYGCEEALCTDRDVTLTSQGVTAGGRFTVGVAWVRAGLAMEALRVESAVSAETYDPGLGWNLAVGAAIPVGRGFRIRPGISYVRHGVEEDHAALLAAELGVAMRF